MVDRDKNPFFEFWIYNFEKNDLLPKFWDSFPLNSDEILLSFSNGAFTTFRTRNRSHAFQFTSHLDRLKESILLAGNVFPYDFNQIRMPLRALLAQQKGKEHRVRLHVPFDSLDLCVIVIEHFEPYAQEYYSQGVHVRTNHLVRQNPQAKLTSFTKLAAQEKSLIKKLAIEESIIVGENHILLEGLSSNFFGIKANILYTANDGILYGITRKMILEVVEKANIEIVLKPVSYTDLNDLQEAFISSTSRLVMPVVSIDATRIGDGKPGKLTKKVSDLFNVRFNQEFELI